MIYILSYFRRLTVKSSLYFSFIPALIIGVATCSFFNFFSSWAMITLLQYFISFLVNSSDLKKETNLPCVLCGFAHCSLLYPARKKNLDENRGSFACSSFDHGKYPDIYYCPNCKNGFLKNILDKDDEQFISDGIQLYEEVEDKEYIKNLDARYTTNRNIINDHLDLFKDKSVLEIGSYYGAFAHEVTKVCGDYTGIEPSRHGCEYVRANENDVTIINATIDSFDQDPYFENKKFDTIVLWDVIEHIPSPVTALAKLNKFLKDDGVVIFSTINIESTFSIAMGPKWPWFMDMHYYYFSDRGYIDILHRSGFVLKNHLHYPYYVQLSYFIKKVLSILGFQKQLPSFIEKNFSYHLKLRLGDTVMIIGQKASN